MIFAGPMIAQADDSGIVNLFGPISDAITQEIELKQSLLPTQSATNRPSYQAGNIPSSPVWTLGTFLKTRFFGKKIPLSDHNHNLTGLGVVVGIEAHDGFYYFILHDLERPETFKAKVIFEKDLFGRNFRDVSPSGYGNNARLDSELRISNSVAPLFDKKETSSNDFSNLENARATTPSLRGLAGEDMMYLDRSSGKFLKGTICFFQGKPYFQDDGSSLFVRAEVNQ